MKSDSVVKIDGELEKKIEELIKRERFLYKSKKQVVDLAILEFLKSKNALGIFKPFKKQATSGFLKSKGLILSEKRSKKKHG